MPEHLEAWQRREIFYEVLPALVDSDKPASQEAAEQLKAEWQAAGYTAMVEAYGYLNRQKRRANR